MSFNKKRTNYTRDGKLYETEVHAALSHTEYNTTTSSQERVVEVSENENDWYQRVLIISTRGRFITWTNAETVEDVNDTAIPIVWKYMREIQSEQIVELTLKDISEGKGVGVPVHLIRIK